MTKFSATAIATIAVIVVARLLTPEEIGVFSVGYAVIAVAHTLRDFGVTSYLIQEPNLTRDHIKTALGITTAAAWSLAAILFAASGTIAQFYDNVGVGEVIRILCLNFLLLPFSSPVFALLRREMNFGALMRIRVTSSFAHAGTSIALAYLGFSYYSLAWSSVVQIVVVVIMSSLAKPDAAMVLPGFKEWRRVLSFGGRVGISKILETLGNSANDLIIGRILGFTSVGLFSRAQGLINLFDIRFMEAVEAVMLPAFSAKNREGSDLKQAYIRSVEYLTVFAWPFFGVLIFTTFPVVRIMFGDQWDAAIPLIQILCFATLLKPFFGMANQVLVALGEVGSNLRAAIIFQGVRVGAIVIAATYSLTAVAASMGLVYLIAFVTFSYFLRRHLGLNPLALILSCWRSLGVALLSVAVPATVHFTLGYAVESYLIHFAYAASGATLGWLIGIFVFRHPVRIDLQAAASKVFRRSKQ
ncbi:lipopolysaccharide biosynthesis protein [Magnetospira sp. QH-2]|uniref:lipopolysaccharide biosynthesis protein n=1 Tax=Magnetospira sp. (strain QH-2) TaxID=1288970 RepID=UPI00130D8F08|nr:lipopolysaccharide biosynthesis protein [Magnetospira sp. QH-2]